MQVEISRKISIICAASLSLALGACSSIIEGTSQVINVATEPADAACTLTRDGRVLGMIPRTPGAITVEKNANGIRIDCQKPGFETTTQWVDSEFAAAVLGNILLGGVVGVVVDSASGASRKYAGQVTIALARPGAAPSPTPTPASTPASTPVAALPAALSVATETPAAVKPPPPGPSFAPTALKTVSAEDRLRSLQDMLDRKAITRREFESKRAAILAGN